MRYRVEDITPGQKKRGCLAPRAREGVLCYTVQRPDQLGVFGIMYRINVDTIELTDRDWWKAPQTPLFQQKRV